MPEGKGYGPQFTASAGLNLNYIGSHVYGYSGVFEFTNTEAFGLDFTTGDEYIMARVYWGFQEPSGDNVETRVYMNTILVYAMESNNGFQDYPHSPMYIDLLIPPLTRVQIGAINEVSTARDAIVTLTGRLYK